MTTVRLDLAVRALKFLARNDHVHEGEFHAPEIAAMTGIPVRTLYRWKAKQTTPHDAVLDKLLKAARARGFKG